MMPPRKQQAQKDMMTQEHKDLLAAARAIRTTSPEAYKAACDAFNMAVERDLPGNCGFLLLSGK